MFRKNSGIENFQAKEGEPSRFCPKFLLSHRTEKTSPGNHSAFHKFFGSGKFFMDERGELSRFSVENYLSHCAKIYSLENNFVFQKVFYFKSFHAYERGGGVTVPSKFFVSQDWNEKFCKGPLLFSRKLMITKNFMHNSGITFFCGKLLVSQCPNILWASLQCFRKLGVSKNFMQNRVYHNFPSKNNCFIEPKNFVKEHNTVSLVSGFKKCWG